ncbi:rod-determining factor RdfA [Salarchaeum japonicum]|uniref:Uncharacterized protein n=1 Tax=Salarchaeum japonicum TaxID=555573 RepID=A0AAV3T3W2_9EURY|nr:rod-determining factor RdfA [Salarchaeum japonicum]
MTTYGCKVCRLFDEYDLTGYEERLVDQWTADGSRRKGYRSLADWLNVALLRNTMDRAGLQTLGDEAESKYERLQGDDATAAEVRNVLREEGVPIDDLESDFVSYAVVRTHLKDCLGVERTDTSTTDSNWEEDALDIAASHAESKASEAVSSLTTKNRLSAGGDLAVHATVEVECENCRTRVPVERALHRGYVCQCNS